mgnify:CR=1 FL=1
MAAPAGGGRRAWSLLIDGSRSMREYAPTALQLAVAIAISTLRIEVFTFSTALQRVTVDVRRAAAGETRRLPSACVTRGRAARASARVSPTSCIDSVSGSSDATQS